MAAQDKVALGSPDGPDNPTGADTLYAGFTKLNNNIDKLKAVGTDAADSGASQIGFNGAQTNVQDAIDNITYPTNGNTTASNEGTGAGLIFIQKADNILELRNIKGGSNCTVEVDTNDIVINSTASAANTSTVTEVTQTGGNHSLGTDDEIVSVDTEGTATVDVTLTNAFDNRIVTIKNKAWTGNAASWTANSHEVTITADTGDKVEDDRTGLPVLQTAIGPGSAMRIIYDSTSSVWSII